MSDDFIMTIEDSDDDVCSLLILFPKILSSYSTF